MDLNHLDYDKIDIDAIEFPEIIAIIPKLQNILSEGYEHMYKTRSYSLNENRVYKRTIKHEMHDYYKASIVDGGGNARKRIKRILKHLRDVVDESIDSIQKVQEEQTKRANNRNIDKPSRSAKGLVEFINKETKKRKEKGTFKNFNKKKEESKKRGEQLRKYRKERSEAIKNFLDKWEKERN